MIKAVIIDDEKHCTDKLLKLLEENFNNTIEVLNTFKTVEEGVIGINKLRPDLVFLDVEIKDKTGFNLLQQLKNISFEVIFTTAYDKYAVQAFKFSAIDYLLKPVSVEDLQTSVIKLQKKVSQEEIRQKLDALFYNLRKSNASKKISIPVSTGLMILSTNDIVRCESTINYTTIFIKDNQKHLVAKTLKEFDDLLSDYSFFRIHNSHLINLNYVKGYNKGKGGSVVMKDGTEIEISTRRKDDFLKKLNAFL